MITGVRKFLLIAVISIAGIPLLNIEYAYGKNLNPFFEGVDCTVVRFSTGDEKTDVVNEAMSGFSSKAMSTAIRSVVEKRKDDGLNVYFANFGNSEGVCPEKKSTLFYDIKVSSRWGRFLNPPMRENFVVLSSSYQRMEPTRDYPAKGFYTPKLVRLADDPAVFLKELSEAADEELKQFVDKPLLGKEYKRKDESRNSGNKRLVE